MDEPATVEQRVELLERQMKHLLSRLPTPDPISPVEAEQLVMEELGAIEERETESVQEDATEGGWGPVSSARQKAAKKAQTQQARTLPDNFNPGLMGYTGFDFVADFPGVDAKTVLDSFISHHRSKGDVSKNWMEKFFSYSANAVRIEKERRQSQPKQRETDSMGLPLDRAARQRQREAEREHQQQLDRERGTAE